jgi:hypothetical protein
MSGKLGCDFGIVEKVGGNTFVLTAQVNYVRQFACEVRTNVFLPTFSTIPKSYPSQCIPIPTRIK